MTSDTRSSWRDASVSPGNIGCHRNHNGESQYLNGRAMGKKMAEMRLRFTMKPFPSFLADVTHCLNGTGQGPRKRSLPADPEPTFSNPIHKSP